VVRFAGAFPERSRRQAQAQAGAADRGECTQCYAAIRHGSRHSERAGAPGHARHRRRERARHWRRTGSGASGSGAPANSAGMRQASRRLNHDSAINI
jgi:hypothetical protein